ncbi:MAG: carotenoid biosynthesis protein [Bacteroidota bacterium]
MKQSPRSISGSAWATRWPLAILFVFTAIAGIGYATFGRHPQLLQHTPQFAEFFSISFTFFAQTHILLTALCLCIYLTYRVQLRWLGGFAAVYLISLGSELTGTATGLPFGPYSYTSLLGPKWLDLVPVLIPLSWFTMALPSYFLAYITFPNSKQFLQRIGFGGLLLMLWDLALDPAMSYLTPYWQWGETGTYYGMPWINLAGWLLTGIVLMAALYLLKVDNWISRLSASWMVKYYLLVLMMPMVMVVVAGLWWSVGLTVVSMGLCALYINHKAVRFPGADNDGPKPLHEALETEELNDYFMHHSRSFSFAARFFSPEQHRLVTRLYAFCRTTDDIADIYGVRNGKEEALKQLEEWERRVHLSYQGIPSNITWLDELMTRSVQSGVPYQIISDLIEGVRSDLDKVELQTMAQLDRYTYCVASVVGIWLCYLFGVREQEVLDRAAALGRAMQVSNIMRDVGEDLRMHRLYLPAELMKRHGVTKDELLAMEAGTLRPTEAYKILVEDLLERAEADYNFAFRGLSAIPPSFARAAAVASEVYKGIHRSIRRNKYNNFQRRAYTRWYEKIYLAARALNRLRKTQKRPFIPANQSLPVADKNMGNGKQIPFSIIVVLLVFIQSLFINQATFATHGRTHTANLTVLQQQVVLMHESVIEELRAKYIAAVENEAMIVQAMTLIEKVDDKTPAIQAYAAAFDVLRAKHAFWPLKKMKHLRNGLPRLDALVARHPVEVEIRYLRLLSCYYLPRFLGRSDTVTQDFKALAYLLPDARASYPSQLYYDMVEFVASNSNLSQEERSSLHVILQEAPRMSTASR